MPCPSNHGLVLLYSVRFASDKHYARFPPGKFHLGALGSHLSGTSCYADWVVEGARGCMGSITNEEVIELMVRLLESANSG